MSLVLSEATLKAIQLRCSKCKKLKPATEFTRDNLPHRIKNRHGRSGDCKECMSIRCKRYRLDMRLLEPEYCTARERKNRLRSKYGILDFDLMLAKQFGKCAICRGSEPGGKGVFHADHSHSTGKTRGLLCYWCNGGLGSFNDGLADLAEARFYLEWHSCSYETPCVSQESLKKSGAFNRRKWKRNWRLQQDYNVDLKWYQEKLLEQGNACAICRSLRPGGRGNFCVDHCHITKKNRGLLCFKCNVGIGMFRHNSLTVHKAITYLNLHELIA